MDERPPDRQGAKPEDIGIAWMFQNSQVSDQELCAALIQEYSDDLYRTASRLTSQPGQARQAVLFTLAYAISERNRYWGTVQPEEWLDEKLTWFCDQIKSGGKESLAPGPDQPVLPAEEEILSLALESRLRRRRKTGIWVGLLTTLVLAAALGLVWWAGSAKDQSKHLQPGQLWFTYTYYPGPDETYDSIAKKTGISVEAIRAANQDSSAEKVVASYPVKLPAYVPDWWDQPVPKPDSSPPAPLSLTSTTEEIKQRILNSDRYFSTLWIEYQLFSYRMPGYLGSPKWRQRLQIWFRKPGMIRMIGATDRSSGFLIAALYDRSHIYYIDTSRNQIQGSLISESEYNNMWHSLLMNYSLPGQINDLKIIGSETIAGRQALVVDVYDKAGRRTERLWIDQILGIVLDHRIFAGRDHNTVFYEWRVTKIVVDARFNNSIFDPTMKGEYFAQDPSGKPETAPQSFARPDFLYGPSPQFPASFQLPPPGFDPSHSQLTIFWPDSPPAPQEVTPGPPKM